MSPKASRGLSVSFFALAVAALAACGSRTGLFGSDDPLGLPDGGVDSAVRDTGPDVLVPCTPGKFNFDLATAQLMFVIDRSGSMAFALDGQRPDTAGNLPPGILSRWDTLRDALFQTITPFDNTLAMGAKFYPEVLVEEPGQPAPAEEACRTDVGVGIRPALGRVSDIIDVFDQTSPIGGTPTSEAIRLAAEYLATARGVARTIIVATDGAPNCNGDLDRKRCVCTSLTGNCGNAPGGEFNCLDDVRTISVVKDTFAVQKIPVYVIGIGSTERPEFLQVLDNMALAGGRPRAVAPFHYNVQTSAELKGALQSIGDSISKCTYLTPSSPTDPNAIKVEINGKTVARDTTHTNGWDWVDQATGTLSFFGTSCVTASASEGGTPQIGGTVSCKTP